MIVHHDQQRIPAARSPRGFQHPALSQLTSAGPNPVRAGIGSVAAARSSAAPARTWFDTTVPR